MCRVCLNVSDTFEQQCVLAICSRYKQGCQLGTQTVEFKKSELQGWATFLGNYSRRNIGIIIAFLINL